MEHAVDFLIYLEKVENRAFLVVRDGVVRGPEICDSIQVRRTRLESLRTQLEFVVVATRTRQTHQNQQFFFW